MANRDVLLFTRKLIDVFYNVDIKLILKPYVAGFLKCGV